MNRLKFLQSCGGVLALTAVGAVIPRVNDKKTDAPVKKSEEMDFQIFEFPRKVRQTVMDFAGDGTIVEIAKKRQGARDWTFAVRYIRKGHNLILTVASTGRLIRIEGDDEEERAPSDKPRNNRVEKENRKGNEIEKGGKEGPDARAADANKPVEENNRELKMPDDNASGGAGQDDDSGAGEPDEEENDDEEQGGQSVGV
jgi:hypothetical protein